MKDIENLYRLRKINEIFTLVGKSLSPEIINTRVISLGLRHIDVSKTVYHRATSEEIIAGWLILVKAGIPVSLYTRIFTFYSLDIGLFPKKIIPLTPMGEVNHIDNDTEPLILELVRLCYWLNLCKMELDSESYNIKLVEVKRRLKFKRQRAIEEEIQANLVKQGQSLRKSSEPEENRVKSIRDYYYNLDFQKFRRNVTSLIPELMCAILIKEEGYQVRFIRTSKRIGVKKSDLLFETSKVEIKTFLDPLQNSDIAQSSLINEIEHQLRSPKVIQHIEEGLEQGAHIVMLFLTFSKISIALAKYSFTAPQVFTIGNSMEEAKKSLLSSGNEVPVVLFHTLIDTSNCTYRLISKCYRYKIEVDVNGVTRCKAFL